MITSTGPGVKVESIGQRPVVLPDSGVPAFFGALAADPSPGELEPLSHLGAFTRRYGPGAADTDLGRALGGWFSQRGGPCFVFTWAPGAQGGLTRALDRSQALDGVDLIAAPGVVALDLQQELLAHCAAHGERLALLDGPSGVGHAPAEALDQVRGHVASLQQGGCGAFGALWAPWLWVYDGQGASPGMRLLPPSAVMAGQLAAGDRELGLHAAAANRALAAVVDVSCLLPEVGEGAAFNPIRPQRRRGIAAWGNSTLSPALGDRTLSTRRVVLAVARHGRTLLEQLSFESNDITLWMRVHRTLGGLLSRLHQVGALKGQTAEQAYYVKCDDENNPQELRHRGQLLVEVGIAPTRPLEFIVLRILRGAERTVIT